MLSSCGKLNNKKEDIIYGYEQKSESTTKQAPYTIDGQNVSSDSFEMHIPEEYSLTDNGNSLRIENENKSFDISIEEHKYSNESFEQYISTTIDNFRQIGYEVSKPEAVLIGDYDMQRIKLSFMYLQAYGYFVDRGETAVLLMLLSNEKEISHDETDAFIEQACISF